LETLTLEQQRRRTISSESIKLEAEDWFSKDPQQHCCFPKQFMTVAEGAMEDGSELRVSSSVCSCLVCHPVHKSCETS
jgi:hypothetical protein